MVGSVYEREREARGHRLSLGGESSKERQHIGAIPQMGGVAVFVLVFFVLS
jgi:hypothetical protein